MNNFKKFLLPAFMVLAGAGSAFATHASKEDVAVPLLGYAYHPNETVECVPSDKTCDTDGVVICTADVGIGTEDMYEWNGTTCQNKLFERIAK